MKTFKGKITKLAHNQVVVVGTNSQGRSKKGAALWALENAGLKYGHIRGICGQTYAIETKDLRQKEHPSVLESAIIAQIFTLYRYATINPDTEFIVLYSGTGTNLNGYTPQEMADMFSCEKAPDNMVFEEKFSKLLTL